MCLKCRKSDHIKSDCPLISTDKYKKKKKVMCAKQDELVTIKARKILKKEMNHIVALWLYPMRQQVKI